jgi:hypothetical protein
MLRSKSDGDGKVWFSIKNVWAQRRLCIENYWKSKDCDRVIQQSYNSNIDVVTWVKGITPIDIDEFHNSVNDI